MEGGPPGSTPSLEIPQEYHDVAVAAVKLFELLANNNLLNDEVMSTMAKHGVKTIIELACCFGFNSEAQTEGLLFQWQAACAASGWAALAAGGETRHITFRLDPPTWVSGDVLNTAGLIRYLQDAAADDDPAHFEPGWPVSLRCPADEGGPNRAQAAEELGRHTASYLEAAGQCRPGAASGLAAVVVNPPQGLPRQGRHGSSSTLPPCNCTGAHLCRLCQRRHLKQAESAAPAASANDDKRRRLH
jgi:hypothetical protein